MSGFDHKDGGFKSRKMIIAYVAMIFVAGGYWLTAIHPALATVYAEYCMGVLGAAAIYAGSNSAVKWMSSRVSAGTPAAAPKIKTSPVPDNPDL